MAQVPVIFLAFANDQVDNASYLRNLPKELDGIRKALHDAQKAGLCEIVERANVTIEQLLDVFQSEEYRNRIAIFHYGGHANGFQLLLEALDGSHASASSDGLIPFLGRQRGLKMVFLNGCSSQQQSLDLIREGVPAVVGTSQSINDDVATALAIRFYKGIGQGIELGQAWDEAVDAIKLEHGGASGGNVRDLFWEGAEESTVLDRFPWDMNYREGSEIVKGWNLPDEVGNPLFNLPEIPPTYALPESPFLFFNRYDRKYAPVFFGRSYYIRDLFNKITNDQAPPVVLLYGQSGVGKSSLLDAGLLPRLETAYATRYIRRDDQVGLVEGLKEALQWGQWEGELGEEEKVGSAGEEAAAGERESKIDPSVEARKNKIEALILHLEDQMTAASPVTKTSLREAIKGLQQDLRIISVGSKGIPAKNILPEDKIQHLQGALKDWRTIEARLGKPLLLIVDQVEELFTRPVEGQESELNDFVLLLSEIFSNPSTAPKGKIMLGYRKEYSPDIEEAFKQHQLPRNRVFLESISKKDIVDIFKGLSETPALQERYNLQVEKELPYIVADDLLEDRNSAVAPVLQILLTKLWQEATKKDLATPSFTIDMYQKLKREGILLDDFFHQQMEKMRTWAAEVELSGLALDILQYHTTKLGTAGSRNIKDIHERYQHRNDIIDGVMDKFKELYLLNESGRGMTTLAHDTIAPLIQMEFRHSDRPGQRATRILDNKAIALEQDQDTSLDFEDLELVEEGRDGMRFWVRKEQALIDRSRKRKEQYINTRRHIKKLSVAAVIAILVVAVFGVSQWSLSKKLLQDLSVSSLEYRAKALANDNPTLALGMAKYLYDKNRGEYKPQLIGNLRETLVRGVPYRTYQSVILNGTESNAVAFSEDGQYVVTQDANTYKLKLWTALGEFVDDIADDYSVALSMSFAGGDTIKVHYQDGSYREMDREGNDYSTVDAPKLGYNSYPFWHSIDGRAFLYQKEWPDDLSDEQLYEHMEAEGNTYYFLNAYSSEAKRVEIPEYITNNIISVNSLGNLVAFQDTVSTSGLSIYSIDNNEYYPWDDYNYQVHELAFSKYEPLIAILTYSGDVIWIDYEGNVVRSVRIEDPEVYYFTFSPDETHFLAYSYTNEEVLVWESSSGRLKHRLKQGSDFDYIGFTSDNASVFAAAGTKVYSWGLESSMGESKPEQFKGGEWTRVFPEPFNGLVNFAGDNDYVIGVKKNDSLAVMSHIDPSLYSENVVAAMGNVSNFLFIGGYIAQLESGLSSYLINSIDPTGQTPNPFSGYNTPVLDRAWTSVASSPSGKYVVSGSQKGDIYTWDLQTGKVSQAFNPFETVMSGSSPIYVAGLHIDDESNFVAVYNNINYDSGADEVQVYLNLPTMGVEDAFSLKVDVFKKPVRAVAISPNYETIALASSQQVFLWNRSGQFIEKCNIPVDNIQDIAFSKDGEKLLVASKTGIYAWRVFPALLSRLQQLQLNAPALTAEVQQEISNFNGQVIYDFSDPIFHKKMLMFFFMLIMGMALVNHAVDDFEKGLYMKVAIYAPSYTLLLMMPLISIAEATSKYDMNRDLNDIIDLMFPVFLIVVFREIRLARKLSKTWQSWLYISLGILGVLGFLILALYGDFSLVDVESMSNYFLLLVAVVWIHASIYLWYKNKKLLFYLLTVPMVLLIMLAILGSMLE